MGAWVLKAWRQGLENMIVDGALVPRCQAPPDQLRDGATSHTEYQVLWYSDFEKSKQAMAMVAGRSGADSYRYLGVLRDTAGW